MIETNILMTSYSQDNARSGEGKEKQMEKRDSIFHWSNKMLISVNCYKSYMHFITPRATTMKTIQIFTLKKL